MPYTFAFALGFNLATLATASLLACLVPLLNSNYGRIKDIPKFIISASSIDNILAVTLFGMLSNIAVNYTGQIKVGSHLESNQAKGKEIASIFI